MMLTLYLMSSSTPARGARTGGGIMRQVKAGSFMNFASNHEFFPKLKEIRERLDMLTVEMLNFNLNEGLVKKPV